MEWNAMIKAMKSGDKEAVSYALHSSVAIYEVNGIIFTVLHKMTEFGNELLNLSKNDELLMGYRVGDFATAGLDILGIKEYEGSSEHVKKLIASKFSFYGA